MVSRLFVSALRPASPSLLEGRADPREGAIHLAAQEGEDQDDHNGDEYQYERVLHQALASLPQLFQFLPHCLSPPFATVLHRCAGPACDSTGRAKVTKAATMISPVSH